MAYSSDRNFGDWAFVINQKATSLIACIEAGEVEYQKFTKVAYGLSDDQVAALPGFTGRTAPDVVNLRYALGALHDAYVMLTNVGGVAQRDRMGDLIPFL